MDELKNLDELEDLRNKMHKIKTWINAYPLQVFPEPDFKKVHEILKAHSMTLDAISASNMRYILNEIKAIIDT
jgi:hypothetical protein